MNLTLGKSSSWCRIPLRYNEMKNFENLWVRHQAEFFPYFNLKKRMQINTSLGYRENEDIITPHSSSDNNTDWIFFPLIY